ncbi:molybdopterin-synthase adenylyltransferase MoeB [Blastopirellula sp. JC732]|uniref:Molybdopterin-synthase adenylyltransferase n=1 Tax=Blastopirellula sediminis TaxID=2894196 RepID=A0A9X1MM85_9BACT|nr:molybdopterin-synthase adenylyltransferase MoeB [Blastopirellula sediminis]MCC9608408.1 molybdopterin-synthase adenylyltransferase MoeB [Blastopirellula sediminis]MCC9628815.1 molybdopterin-synthase adenylyltransferase MoeB [Blastopirellula sediminis]
MNTTFDREELQRYSRQITLPPVGVAGQEKLKAASVLVIGAGGLGSPAAMYLAAAGVGRLGIVDADEVDLSNLHRQIIHSSQRVGKSKVDSAAATLGAINPHVQIEPHPVRLTAENARELITPYDVVLDGTDNFATRYLVNDACVLLGKPNCYGSILKFEGQAAVFGLAGGPCYRCLYPTPPQAGFVPNCAEAGVFGVLPGVIGTIQATEAIKLILGIGEPLSGRLLTYDALKMRFRQLQIVRDSYCPVCGDDPTIRTLEEVAGACSATPASATISAASQSPWDVSVDDLKRRIDSGDAITILDVREPAEFEICNIGGTLIPMSVLPARFRKLDRSATYIVHCKSGMRSSTAVQLLRDFGFESVYNLNGGIDAWLQKFGRA